MAAFDIKDKVALITGGASGLGFSYALALLEKGARGVTLADTNSDLGSQAVNEIGSKYGTNKVIFVETDVTSYEKFEDAFKKTLTTFKNIDILINNAGIANDLIWQKEIATNVNGTIHGILLGLEIYLPKYKSGSEGLIINASSILGLNVAAHVPIYSGTKYAIHGMTLCWGSPAHYNRTKVRVVGICPGLTLTPMGNNVKCLGPDYEELAKNCVSDYSVQMPEQVASSVMQIIEKAENGTIWVIEGGEPAYQYRMPNRFEIPKVYP